MFWLSWWSIYKFKFEVNCFLSRVSDLTAEGKMCFASIIFLMTFFFSIWKTCECKKNSEFFFCCFFFICESELWNLNLRSGKKSETCEKIICRIIFFSCMNPSGKQFIFTNRKKKDYPGKTLFFPLLEVLQKFVSSWSTFCVWSDLFTIWEK